MTSHSGGVSPGFRLIQSTLVSFAQILLIQIILIRNNGFVKRKIGNLFETRADDGKLSKMGAVFSGYSPLGPGGLQMPVSSHAARSLR
jgi:hypothetical protein